MPVMDRTIRTNCYDPRIVALIILETTLFLTGIQCFKWHIKPESRKNAEVGNIVTFSWRYSLASNERLKDLHIYLNVFSKNIVHRNIDGKYRLNSNFKNDTKMLVGENLKISISIKAILKEPSDRYCCIVTFLKNGDFGSKLSCVELEVYERPRIHYITRNLTTSINSSVDLVCNSSGHPQPFITWYKMDNRSSLMSNSSNTTIQIERPETYCCIAKNVYANNTACTMVRIGDSPVLLNNTAITYTMNSSIITITCQATGEPQPIIEWTSDDTKEPLHKSIEGTYNVIHRECISKTLVYYCKAVNKMGVTPRRKIIVHVDASTLPRCQDNSTQGTSPPDVQGLIAHKLNVPVLIIIVCISAVVVVALVVILICRLRRKQKHLQAETCSPNEIRSPQNDISLVTEESPYGEPFDAIKTPEGDNRHKRHQEPLYGEPIDAIIRPSKPINEYASPQELGITERKDVKRSSIFNKFNKKTRSRPEKDQRTNENNPGPIYEELPMQRTEVVA